MGREWEQASTSPQSWREALVSIKTAGLAAGMPQFPTWEQAKGFASATAKLVWHGHAD
jgi:hypothetical protein